MTTIRGRRTAARTAAAPFAWLAEAAARWLPEPVADASTQPGAELGKAPGLARGCRRVWVDACQRSVLFWDVLRKRGNLALEHCRNGKPPVLVFDYDLIVDGRQLERPVNYMLLRITPERGVATDPKKRPFVIVDPRAGHGPGIGSFKEESEVGVALLGTRAVSPANIHRNLCGS